MVENSNWIIWRLKGSTSNSYQVITPRVLSSTVGGGGGMWVSGKLQTKIKTLEANSEHWWIFHRPSWCDGLPSQRVVFSLTQPQTYRCLCLCQWVHHPLYPLTALNASITEWIEAYVAFVHIQAKLILPHQVCQSDHWSDLDNRCALELYEQEWCKQPNIHYDVTGLLSAVWKVTLRSDCLGCLSWICTHSTCVISAWVCR